VPVTLTFGWLENEQVRAESTGDNMLEKRVIYELPGMKEVTKQSIIYASDHDIHLTMDIYYPPNLSPHSQLPAVIFVPGYPNSVILERFGIKLKNAGQYVSWGQLAAKSGMIAIIYETTQPEKEIYSVLTYIRKNATTLQIDGDRLGVWACSGNVPTALSVLIDPSTNMKCAVLYYGAMFDWNASHEMAKKADRSGFVYPCKAKSVDDLPQEIPLFVVRTGEDNLQLNQSIEHFVCKATKRNLPLTFVNYADGQHAFDVENSTRRSQEIIKQTLEFLHEHLFQPCC
jgi:acetyl esterase/lipase